MCDYRRLDETSVFKLGPLKYNIPVLTPIRARDIFETFDNMGKEYWVKFKDDSFKNNNILLPLGFMIKLQSPTQFYTLVKCISPVPKLRTLQKISKIIKENPVVNYTYDFPIENITKNLTHYD